MNQCLSLFEKKKKKKGKLTGIGLTGARDNSEIGSEIQAVVCCGASLQSDGPSIRIRNNRVLSLVAEDGHVQRKATGTVCHVSKSNDAQRIISNGLSGVSNAVERVGNLGNPSLEIQCPVVRRHKCWIMAEIDRHVSERLVDTLRLWYANHT